MRPEAIRVLLRPVEDGDLEHFFQHQLDEAALEMARIGPSGVDDFEVFKERWAHNLGDDSIYYRTIEVGGRVAGYVISFEFDGERQVGYWLGQAYWGRGVATEAMKLMLRDVLARPLFGVTVPTNAGSIRVLEKCGFLYKEAIKTHSRYQDEEVDAVKYELT